MWMQYSSQYWPEAVDLKSAISRLGSELDALAMDALHSANYDMAICWDPEAVAIQNGWYNKYREGSRLCCEYGDCKLDSDTLCEKFIILGLRHFLEDILPYLTPQIRSKHGLDEGPQSADEIG